MALSLHSILTVCHQHGVDFRLSEDKVLYSGDIQKVGPQLLALVKAKKADGSLRQFFLENPSWVPGKAPETVVPGQAKEPPSSGEADAAALEAAKAITARRDEEARPAAQGQMRLPLAAQPEPPQAPPAASAPALATRPAPPLTQIPPSTRTTRGMLLQNLSPERAQDFKAVGQCWPCGWIYYIIETSELDPRRCHHCGNVLLGPGGHPGPGQKPEAKA